jgi:hypothetical protein
MTRPVSTPESSPAGWMPAPAGSFVRMRDRLQGVRRRRQFFQAAAGGLAAAGAVALGWSFLSGGERDYGGIRCSDVRSNTAACHPDQLDEETRGRIKAHLERCARCRSALGSSGSCDTPACK